MPPAAWPVREPVRAKRSRPARSLFALSLSQEAREIAPKLLRVEANSEILDAEDAAAIDDRSEERVVDVAIRILRGEDAIAAREVLNDRRGTGEEAPAGNVRPVHLRVQLEHFRRVVLRVDRDGSEHDLAAEITPEPVLHQRHHRRQHRASVAASCEDEGYGHHLAAKVCK